VSIKIKSPVPMVVAMCRRKSPTNACEAEMFESALEKNSCQQRGVQSLQFHCTFNAGDGPQSLIVVPESTAIVRITKKAESRCRP